MDGIEIFFILVVFFLSVALFLNFVHWFHKFRKELKHLKGEIRRTTGAEKQHWIRKKRKLWFSLLPFVRY